VAEAVTDKHSPEPRPDEGISDDEAPKSAHDADPRLRPPDPAGTQPRWDPETLLPEKAEARPGGALWDPFATDDPEKADGDTETVGAGDAQRADAGVAVAVATDPPASKYAPRFQFVLGALLAVAAASIVLLVLVLLSPTDDKAQQAGASGPAWSTWHPSPSGADGPTQIAEHVGQEYRLPNGKQMVAVTGGPLQIAGLPVTVAVRQSAAQGGDIKLFDGTGVLYRLCGLGDKCAITEGKASTKRHLLLRREALELALYSFRYLDGVDEAVVFLPPRKGQDPTQALFFRRSDTDLRNAVSRPLDATLVRQTPSVSSVTQSPDAQLVNTITTNKLFSFSFTQANQDARAFLVLDPLTGR
jgi:hypothetical protein